MVKHGAHPDISQNIIGANLLHTGFVQVQLHLHRRLHLHVVLEEAAAKRGLVVGLLCLGLDGRLHPGRLHPGGSSVNDKSPVYAGSLQISNSVSNPPRLMKER